MIRNCPKCNDVILYKSKYTAKYAELYNKLCRSCNSKRKKSNKKKEWNRKCPNCKTSLYYNSKYDCEYADKKQSLCSSCAGKISHPLTIPEPPYLKNCPKCKETMKYTRYDSLQSSVQKNRACNKCNPFSRKAIKLAHLANIGKPCSDETRRKIRLGMIEYIKRKRGQITPGYNIKACRIFDNINHELGWNGKHAENGGEYHIKELGYWVDYYEPTLNLVIEYDEKWHNKQKDRDAIRQQEIEQYLHCRFYRIRESQSWREVLNEFGR
jgi:hypothetical protein